MAWAALQPLKGGDGPCTCPGNRILAPREQARRVLVANCHTGSAWHAPGCLVPKASRRQWLGAWAGAPKYKVALSWRSAVLRAPARAKHLCPGAVLRAGFTGALIKCQQRWCPGLQGERCHFPSSVRSCSASGCNPAWKQPPGPACETELLCAQLPSTASPAGSFPLAWHSSCSTPGRAGSLLQAADLPPDPMPSPGTQLQG